MRQHGNTADPDTTLKLWGVLSRAASAVSAHERASVATHGLTPAEFSVLETLFHKGPLLLGDVQRKILVSSGGITYLVDRLEKRGLVQRRACPTDRRATYAGLTERGQALVQRIFPEHTAHLERALSGLSDAEKRTMIRLLHKLGQAASALPPEGMEEEAEIG